MTTGQITRPGPFDLAAARRSRLGLTRRARRIIEGERVELRDGSAVLIRQVGRGDAPLLADGFARLSVASRRSRFLMVKNELTPAELRYFTDLDHHDHEAIGALDCIDAGGVGVARYIRDAHDPEMAEVAVTVVDDWQGRGLGGALLHRLSERALQEGVRRFTALVSTDNSAMIAVLQRLRIELGGIRREYDTLEYDIALPLRPVF